MMNIYKFEMAMLISAFIIAVIVGVVGVLYSVNEKCSHEYVVTSPSGKWYYIDDYTIEDGSIIFTIDGVEYHFSNYSIKEIEK